MTNGPGAERIVVSFSLVRALEVLEGGCYGSKAPNASSGGGRRECVTMFSIRKAKSVIEP